jgi:hypothetical protein
MEQRTLTGANISALRTRYDQTVHEALPARAKNAGDWPIHADHCFARVVLDNVFDDVWTNHVTGEPAYKHLSPTELQTAIEIADTMLDEGRPAVTQYNDRSLAWRDTG